MPGSKFILPKTCEICGTQFNAKTVTSKYCSEKCSQAAYRKKKAQIKKGNIPALNLGERLTRISRIHIEAMFSKVETVSNIQPEAVNKKLDYNQNECYTIGEITEKFGISASTVNKTIRKNGIPRKQIGKFVYVPKVEIDRIFAHR